MDKKGDENFLQTTFSWMPNFPKPLMFKFRFFMFNTLVSDCLSDHLFGYSMLFQVLYYFGVTFFSSIFTSPTVVWDLNTVYIANVQQIVIEGKFPLPRQENRLPRRLKQL